jgi:crotonobetainyl-CoA:carnitine CoA-transferase CaiB-like acyl-CoA transferase
MSMNGYPDREGVRALSPVMDISTAMMACNAILGALVARECSGLGQAIEVSLFDNAVLMTGHLGAHKGSRKGARPRYPTGCSTLALASPVSPTGRVSARLSRWNGGGAGTACDPPDPGESR